MASFGVAMASPVIPGSEVEVRVRAIASGGAGVADLPDGRIVFVPRTAPGDRARIRVEKVKSRWAVGSVAALLEAADDREEPPCALYASCGGCQLQHITYEGQLEWKGRFVTEALSRIGHVSDVAAPEVVASPSRTGYRNRATFTLRRLRGGRVVAGFHELRRASRVVDVHDECVLPSARIVDAWVALRSGWGAGARLLPEGGRLRLTVREDGDGIALVVDGGAEGWRAAPLADAVSVLSAVWHRPASADGDQKLVAGTPGDGQGTAFVQVNAGASELLTRHVVETAGPAGRAVDAYCGVGEFGRALAGAGWSAVGIEVHPGACSAAELDAPEGFTVLRGTVEARLAEALPARLLIVNPPRAGLSEDVRGQVVAAAVPRVVYVSCDPATLARDLGVLSTVYRLVGLRCFDLFPQTAHVESVATLASVQEG